MSLRDQPQSIRECYAAHVVLHVGCKVPLEDLFVLPALAPDGTGEAIGVAARQGDFEFIVTCGPFGMSLPDFGKLWLEALPLINKASVEEREAAIEGTWARAHAVEIGGAYWLKRNGLR